MLCGLRDFLNQPTAIAIAAAAIRACQATSIQNWPGSSLRNTQRPGRIPGSNFTRNGSRHIRPRMTVAMLLPFRAVSSPRSGAKQVLEPSCHAR
jgi:hypothetical protein